MHREIWLTNYTKRLTCVAWILAATFIRWTVRFTTRHRIICIKIRVSICVPFHNSSNISISSLCAVTHHKNITISYNCKGCWKDLGDCRKFWNVFIACLIWWVVSTIQVNYFPKRILLRKCLGIHQRAESHA